MQGLKKNFSDNNKSLQQAIGYCLGILAKKDYSRLEIVQKLQTRGFAQSIIYETVQYLETKNFINDERIANNLVEYYYGQKGKNWIKQKMHQRMLNPQIVEQILQDLKSEVNYLSVEQIRSLKRILEKKYNFTEWKELDYQTKTKIFQFLLRRGFTQPLALLNYLSNFEN
jgi:regulatory protein